jgi:hypothetical protein
VGCLVILSAIHLPQTATQLWTECSCYRSDKNCVIIDSYKRGNIEIVKALWNKNSVKNTLKNDDFKIYQKLIQKDIEIKLKNF